MAVNLYCPNCGENLGKDTEAPRKACCDRCGEENIHNPRGYTEEEMREMWEKTKPNQKKS